MDGLKDEGTKPAVNHGNKGKECEQGNQNEPHNELEVIETALCEFGLALSTFGTSMKQEGPVYVTVVVIPVSKLQPACDTKVIILHNH